MEMLKISMASILDADGNGLVNAADQTQVTTPPTPTAPAAWSPAPAATVTGGRLHGVATSGGSNRYSSGRRLVPA